jgi:hypothetical protein
LDWQGHDGQQATYTPPEPVAVLGDHPELEVAVQLHLSAVLYQFRQSINL